MQSGDLTVYRGCTPVADARYGADGDRTPTEAIIDALAEAANVDPVDLPPLYEAVDPDAIERLFEDPDGHTETEALLSFRIDDWNVFVRDDGRIRVCDATEPTDPAPVFDAADA